MKLFSVFFVIICAVGFSAADTALNTQETADALIFDASSTCPLYKALAEGELFFFFPTTSKSNGLPVFQAVSTECTPLNRYLYLYYREDTETYVWSLDHSYVPSLSRAEFTNLQEIDQCGGEGRADYKTEEGWGSFGVSVTSLPGIEIVECRRSLSPTIDYTNDCVLKVGGEEDEIFMPTTAVTNGSTVYVSVNVASCEIKEQYLQLSSSLQWEFARTLKIKEAAGIATVGINDCPDEMVIKGKKLEKIESLGCGYTGITKLRVDVNGSCLLEVDDHEGAYTLVPTLETIGHRTFYQGFSSDTCQPSGHYMRYNGKWYIDDLAKPEISLIFTSNFDNGCPMYGEVMSTDQEGQQEKVFDTKNIGPFWKCYDVWASGSQ
eukprot:Lankesteria_metandrocarpae@DN856_c0_g1_i1.p1